MTIKGFELDEIDCIARILIDTLNDAETERELGLVGLCRAIVLIAEEEELDEACVLIDELDRVDGDEDISD